jgi:hypothetical protein
MRFARSGLRPISRITHRYAAGYADIGLEAPLSGLRRRHRSRIVD